MKKIVLLWGLLGLLVLGSNAQKLNFAESFEQGRINAKEKGRFILVYAYSPCILCDDVMEKVLSLPDVASFLNEHFILVDMDLDERRGVLFKKEYGLKSCPSFVLFDADGNLAHKIAGACSAENLLTKLLRGIDSKINYAGVLKRYNSGERSVELLPDYIFSLDDAGEMTDLSAIINEFFSYFSMEEKVSDMAWALFSAYAGNFRDQVFQDFLNNKDYFVEKLGIEVVNDKIQQVVFPAMQEALQGKFSSADTVLFKKTINGLGDTDRILMGKLWDLSIQKDYAGIMDLYEQKIFVLNPKWRGKYGDIQQSLLKGCGKEINDRLTNYIVKCLEDLRARRSMLIK